MSHKTITLNQGKCHPGENEDALISMKKTHSRFVLPIAFSMPVGVGEEKVI